MTAAVQNSGEKPKKQKQEELDEALDESFPASDPPSSTQPNKDNEEKKD